MTKTTDFAKTTSPRQRLLSSLLTVFLLAVIMMSGTLPTPLFTLYAIRDSLQPIDITIVFSVYAAGILLTLTCFGRLSDTAGRIFVMALAAFLCAISMVIFILWPSMSGLVSARFLSGVSIALMTGASAAYLEEIQGNRNRAAFISGVTNMAGLGLGALIGGITSELTDSSVRTPYYLILALLVPSIFLLSLTETVVRSPIRPLRTPARKKPSSGDRPLFRKLLPAATSAFTSFSVLGLIAALTGTFISKFLHLDSPAIAGSTIFLTFGAAAVAQPAMIVLSARFGLVFGMALLPCGLVVVIVGMSTPSLALYIIGATVCGFGAGSAFRSGITSVVVDAGRGCIASAVSFYFASAYLGLAVPVVGTGILAIWLPIYETACIFVAIIVAITSASLAGVLLTGSASSPRNAQI